MRVLLVLTAAALQSHTVLGQIGVERTEATAAAMVESLFREVETGRDCRMRQYGEPRPDTLSDQWLVVYSASGDECDGAIDALQARGADLDLLFSRRPDRDQLRVLLNRMIRLVGGAFGCRISVRGEPRVNESTGRWFVSYVAVGNDCESAERELGRRGNELEVSFLRARHPGEPDSQILIR